MKDRSLIIIAGLLLITIFIFSLFSVLNSNGNSIILLERGTQEVSLTGTTVCLPHRGNGPHTLECTVGLQSNSKYYGLDLSKVQDSMGSFLETGMQINIEGKLDSVAPDDYRMQSYDIEGVIMVADIETIKR